MAERKCPDDGTCHHDCRSGGCFRVVCCGPLSGVYPGDTWPREIRLTETLADLTVEAVGLDWQVEMEFGVGTGHKPLREIVRAQELLAELGHPYGVSAAAAAGPIPGSCDVSSAGSTGSATGSTKPSGT